MPKITRGGGPSFGNEPADDIPAILADFGVTEAEEAEIATLAETAELTPQFEPEPEPGQPDPVTGSELPGHLVLARPVPSRRVRQRLAIPNESWGGGPSRKVVSAAPARPVVREWRRSSARRRAVYKGS